MSNFKDFRDYEQGIESSNDDSKEPLKEDLQNKSPKVISGSLVVYPEQD